VGAVQGAAASATDIVGEAAKALATPTGLAGATVEALWLGTHLAIYPLGLMGTHAKDVSQGYRIEHLGPVQRGLVISDIEAAGTPILLVHGVVDNRSVFTVLRRGLRRRGFGRVSGLNYSPLTEDVREVALRVGAAVEAICAETGYSRFPVADIDGTLLGYLHIKDVLETDEARRQRAIDDKWIRPFALVRDDDLLHDTLEKLQRRGAHMARVVDASGITRGVATLEDVIEELVGEIRDSAHLESSTPPRGRGTHGADG